MRNASANTSLNVQGAWISLSEDRATEVNVGFVVFGRVVELLHLPRLLECGQLQNDIFCQLIIS